MLSEFSFEEAVAKKAVPQLEMSQLLLTTPLLKLPPTMMIVNINFFGHTTSSPQTSIPR